MATSGTVGATQLDVQDVVDRAIRRCGVLSSAITGEMQKTMREVLFLILSGLANRGVSLWCVQKHVFQLAAARATYTLPIGTVDVLNAFLRYGTVTPATSVALNLVSLTLATAGQVDSCSITVTNAGSYALVFETSPDGVTWTQCGSITQTANAGDILCMDADPSPSNAFWRVRDAVDPTALFTAGAFMRASVEITSAQLSRDDYTNLPNKTFLSLNPLQFWYDKQYLLPKVSVWPVPLDTTRQMVLFLQRHIQDPGAYTNTLEVPQRWLNCIGYMLAQQGCLELPPQLVAEGRYAELKLLADQYLREAEDGEQDGAPVRWQPNIAPYSR